MKRFKNFKESNDDTLDELAIERNEIVKSIEKLMERKREIDSKMLKMSTDFISKFKIWYNNDDECHQDFIVQTPLLRALLDDMAEVRRGKIYTIEDLIGEDDMYVLLNPEGCGFRTKEDAQKAIKEVLDRYQPALQEAMDNNMKSFECDW